MTRGLFVACLAGLATIALGIPAEARDAPPACAAISFHPVSGVPNDGTQDAGLYRSRFGTIVLKAETSGGQARNYFIEINGQRPPVLSGSLPAAVTPCLNAKHVKTPPPPAGAACIGSRFRVVINNVQRAKYVMLFGLQGDTWMLCSASKV